MKSRVGLYYWVKCWQLKVVVADWWLGLSLTEEPEESAQDNIGGGVPGLGGGVPEPDNAIDDVVKESRIGGLFLIDARAQNDGQQDHGQKQDDISNHFLVVFF